MEAVRIRTAVVPEVVEVTAMQVMISTISYVISCKVILLESTGSNDPKKSYQVSPL